MKNILSIFLFFIISLSVSGINITDLTCEMRTNPEGIGTTQPRFGWEIESNERNVKQESYHILVASSLDKLNKNEGDLWDSSLVSTSITQGVRYSGVPLKSRDEVFFKVKSYTNKGESQWSQPSFFSIGLLSESDWKAQWIGMDRIFQGDSLKMHSRLAARYLRKEFLANKDIKSAKVYVSGLGNYELYINGQKTGDPQHVLMPIATDYRKTVLYNTYDVTESLAKGKNSIGVVLGNGRYFNVRQNFKPHKILIFGYPKLLLQMEITYADGTTQIVCSDKTWRLSVNGPIISNNDWDGEEYDARKEMPGWNKVGFKDSKWLNPELVDAPGGAIVAQMIENIKIQKSIRPVSITKLNKDTFILDMGQNMVGWLKMKAEGKKGDQIKLRFAESIQKNGHLYIENLRTARCTDIYIMKGEGTEVWKPSFVYHGFRYVQVTGYPGIPTVDDFEGEVIYDDVETVGSFESSNQLLNQIHKNAYWGISGNYKGMPLDCPQRDERQPWLGDHAMGSLGESYIFDIENLYAKWLDDILDSQTPEGKLSDIAPSYYLTYYSDNMTWPATYLIVADMLYNQYGNAEPIIKHYSAMKKWLSYMQDNYMKDYIITRDKYGDWCVPPESKELIHSQDPLRRTNGRLIATAYYYKCMQLMSKFARLSDNDQDIAEFDRITAGVKQAFNNTFYNANEQCYDNNTVTANLLPLAFGLVDESNKQQVLQQIIERIVVKDKLHISTGVIGTQWLMRELSKQGRVDVAYTIASQKTYPSWGYMVEKGATTIWELWNGDTADPKMNSQNHVMLLGDLISWMYEELAGIKSHKDYPGFNRLWMNPNPTEDLTSVKAHYKSSYGLVKSNWRLDKGVFYWNVTIPANSRANILVPASSLEDISENGVSVDNVEGLKYVGVENGRVNLEIGSGEYSFMCKYGIANNRWKKGVVSEEPISLNHTFPESHASTIAETKEGHLVAAWFGGTREKNPDVCIWLSRFVDGKWSEPENVANGIVNDTLRYACWNPVLYQIPNGDLQLYYKVGASVSEWVGKLKTSKDGGVTWSDPIDLPEGILGPIKNKPVLVGKDLICPSSTENDGWRVHFEITRDFGKTWKKIGPINDGKEFRAIQPSVLTYKDGRIQILCRSQERSITQSWSKDKGKTWSPMSKTMLPNNNSGTDAVSLDDGRQLLVYNHVFPKDTTRGKGERTPLNVAISDDGITWRAALVLEDSPISRYSYPSVIQSKDGLVHIVYSWRRKTIKHVVVDPKQLVLSEIKDMSWPTE